MVTFVGFMLFAITIIAAVLTSPLFSKQLKPTLVEDSLVKQPSASNAIEILNQPRSKHAQGLTVEESGSHRSNGIAASSIFRQPSQASVVLHASFFQGDVGDLAVSANLAGQLSLS